MLWRLASRTRIPAFAMLSSSVEQATVGMTVMNRHHVVATSARQPATERRLLRSVAIRRVKQSIRILDGKPERLWRRFEHSDHDPTAISHRRETARDSPSRIASVDYVFTDPPFGENIYYADLNFLVESWHRVCDEHEPRGNRRPGQGQEACRLPAPDGELLPRVLPRPEARPLDDRRVP